jgi:hypothetical protein
MPKQIGPFAFEGTIGPICFYKLGDRYFARVVSSLDGARVKQDPAFAGLMRHADWLKLASPIASELYRSLPKEKRQRSQYQALTGLGIRLLKEGHAVEDVRAALKKEVGLLEQAWTS